MQLRGDGQGREEQDIPPLQGAGETARVDRGWWSKGVRAGTGRCWRLGEGFEEYTL